MGRKYRNPPIIEAVCEFQITPDTKWDLTIPGLIYEKVRNEFPIIEQRVIFEEKITVRGEELHRQISPSERVLFYSNDRTALIQVGTHLLSANCLKPYPTWEGFKPKINIAIKALKQTIEIKAFQRIGLRYINRIEIPGQSPNIVSEYFEFRPFLGRGLPKDMADFMVGCLLPFSEGRDLCKVRLANTKADHPEMVGFLLDIDYFQSSHDVIRIEDTLAWIDMSHVEIEKVFEGCITEPLRQLFEEVG